MLQAHSLGESVSGHYPRVALGDLLIARPKGLTEPETWAMLYQAVQALQDLFLSDGATGMFSVPLITPATLLLSSRGRVKLCQNPVNTSCSYPVHITGYLAPEYRPNKRYSDTESEKMWIFGLGESLKRATLTSHTATSRLSVELCQVLTDMTRPQAASRASLMYLLDVISEYCARKQQNRPFSHIVMDLHQEALAGVEMNLNTPWTLTAMPEMQGATRSRYTNALPPPLQWWSPNGQISERPKITKEASTSMEDLSSSRLLNLPGTVVRPQSMCVPPTITNHEQIFNRNVMNREKEIDDDFKTIFTHDKGPVMKSALARASNDNGTKTFKNRCRQRRNPVQRAASRLYRAECDDKISRTKEPSEKQCIGPEFIIRANLPSKKIVVADSKGIRKTVTVVMLNGQKIEVECNPSNITAGQLFEEVIRHEHIEENFMLGLSALMAGDFVFLPSDARVCKAVNPPNNLSEITLFVRVRFFLPNLRGLRNSQARHLLYLQIRRSILEYQLPCMFRQFIELGGLALQAEFGDYNEKEHGSRDYFLLEHYVPEIVTCNREKSHQLKEEIVRCHKSKIGLDVIRAEEEFIKMAQTLPHYGGHFCMATWVQKDNIPRNVWLFISAQGINLYERLDVVNPFSLSLLEMFEWKTIQTLCYSKHYLCVIPHTGKINKLKLKKYKLKMDLKKSYFTFRLASLHHQFFLRLKTEYISLQRLSEAFGVPLKEIKNETNSLYKLETLTNPQHINLDKNRANAGTEFKIEFRFPSKKSKSNSHEDLKSQRSKSVGNFSKETGNAHVFEEFQNKENERPRKKQEQVKNEGLILDGLSNLNIWDKRRGVKMGVRAFSNRSGHRNCRSMEAMNVDTNDDLEKSSLQSVSLYYSSSSTRSLMLDKKVNDVYVLDTSIHSHDVNFLPNFHETLSQSLLDKLNDLSFAEERYLCSVVIQRDQKGSFGIQITEGSDGKVYIQSVIPGGPADALKKMKKGDQIIAANQQNLLNYKYEDALEILKKSGNTVELILSQTKNNGKSILNKSSTKERLENSITKGSIDLTDSKECHLQSLKLENAVRKLKHFSYAGGSGSSFGSADTPIEKHLIESCYDITNFNKHFCLPSVTRTATTTDVPYHKHIRYGFEPEVVDCVESKGLPKKTVSASCSNLNYLENRSKSDIEISKSTKRSMEDCRKISMPIALPRSLGLSRKWRGPVKYPVTPIKRERKGSESDAKCLLNTSDDEQVFI
ncbi:FERM and PDZ domain-containing protein 2-like [Agrilus planipennis]|uniref:FERM and PDZ domain-containing protein 2-like n=1 Tax=Agrilus planipennis TaxID=224129 RepID=A0A1W4XJT7_AGRPL|nr:FERM and PDZ domain-containing protein 2-like [Agrilus planipennis]XP_018332724.1 FERM and PDZ domain-containing protein 2-like [Agrilus planipennis]